MNKIKPITNSSLVNPLIASKINEIIGVVNDLALSDKEEKCKHGGDCYTDNGYSKTIPLGYCKKTPKQEEVKPECIHDYYPDNLVNGYEKCFSCKEVRKAKQPTSLKEEISKLIQYTSDYAYDIKTSDKEADKILSLIQSHLLKEIDKLEVQIVDDWTKEVGKQIGYSLNKKDIIKIINNIN